MLDQHKEDQWHTTMNSTYNDPRQFWRILRALGRRRNPNAPLRDNGHPEKDELFASVFELQYTNSDTVPIKVNNEVIYSVQLLINNQPTQQDRFTADQHHP